MTRQPNRNRPAFDGLRMLRLPSVLAATGLGRTKLLEEVKAGRFPKPVRLTTRGRAIGWPEEEVNRWREERKAARDTASAA